VVLTKLDGDARGGAALSVRQVTGQPILFASNGERQDEFDVFHPDRMASRILGMGDVLTLIEQAEQAFEEGQAEAAAAKMGTGELTLEDFLEQMMAVRRMGPIANVLGMLPGAAQMKDQLAGLDEKHLDRVQAIIRGMTPAERADPKIINGSRRLRIANGSGVGVTDVNQLVERFFEARKMMKSMAGQFGLPGMGGGRKGKRQAAKGKGRKGPKSMPAIQGIATEGGGRGANGEKYQTPGLNQLPPALAGMNQLPEGFDPGALTFPGAGGGGGPAGGSGKKGSKKKRK
jgi:signal recognition particle subunit SRP54